MPAAHRRTIPLRTAVAAAALLLMAVSFSCDSIIPFSPAGSNYVDVQKPRPPAGMSINLTGSPDTIPVWGTASFSYSVIPTAGVGTEIICYIDSNRYFPVISNGTISVSTQSFSNGYHSLLLRYFVPTGSNSLASRFGGEYFVTQVKKTLLIDNTPPSGPPSVQVSRTGGRLVISWTAYNRLNFQGYVIHKFHPQVPIGLGYDIVMDTLRTMSVTSYTDSTFIGGSGAYMVTLLALGSQYSSDAIRYDTPFTGAAVELSGDSTATITWPACLFPENFDSYSVHLGDDARSWLPVDSLRNIRDTVATDNQLTFGLGQYYSIMVYSRRLRGRQDSVMVYTNFVWLGSKIPQFSRIMYSPASNSYYLSRADSSFRLNAGDLSVAASTAGLVTVATDGSRACKFLNGLVTEVNPMTFDAIRTVQLPASGIQSIWMTSPDTILYAQMNLAQSIAFIHIGNPAGTKVLSLGNYFPSGVSRNGHYILGSGMFPEAVLRVEHDTLAGSVISDAEYASDFTFMDDGEQFADVASGTLYLRNSSNGSAIRTISVGAYAGWPSEDPVSHLIGLYRFDPRGGMSGYLVYDGTTGTLVRTLPLRLPVWYSAGFNICNHVLFSQLGYCMRLP